MTSVTAQGKTSTSASEELSSVTTCCGLVSVIVPTYREAQNVPRLLMRLAALRDAGDLSCEVLVMDDDSADGTEEAVAALGLPWVTMVVRRADRGLSQAVVDGLRRATGEFLVVMDADLSHPPEAIPKMVARLEAGDDFVIGSRYVTGGSTDAEWGIYRWLNSKVATWLARPFTSARDPMAGFFAMRRSTFLASAPLNPIGYKIGLELLVKAGVARAGEVPIHFADRTAGESKLNFKEQLRYIQHIRRLFVWRYPNWSYTLQFLAVGISGLAVNLAVLSLLVALGVGEPTAVALAIVVSIFTNFLLNRRFTFSYAKHGPFGRQLASFAAASLMGAIINYCLVLGVLAMDPVMPVQIAATLGVIAGTFLNFVVNRYVTFRNRRV